MKRISRALSNFVNLIAVLYVLFMVVTKLQPLEHQALVNIIYVLLCAVFFNLNAWMWNKIESK